MSAATVTFIGADQTATASMAEERALYLKMFAGEVLVAFPKYTIFIDKHRVKNVTSGKSHQFPLIGRMPPAEYHTPGELILGQEAPLAERVIEVDRLLISHLFLDNLDTKLAHFEARGELSANMSRRLALTYDNHVARNLIAAANDSDGIIAADDTMGGLVITDGDLGSGTSNTKRDAWIARIFQCAVNFDNKWVNDGTRWLAIKPEDYYFLNRTAMASGYHIMDKNIGGSGSLAQGDVGPLAGIELVSYPRIPTANYSADAFHKVDCSNTVGICWTQGAAGTVKVFDIGVETDYQIERQGHLLVAKYAMGHGILQSECAVQLKTA